jgi:hypothetical protein
MSPYHSHKANAEIDLRAAQEIKRLKDGLQTIADGELGTIEEAMNFANTLLLSSEVQ